MSPNRRTLIGLMTLLEKHDGPSQLDPYAGSAAVLFPFHQVTSYASVRTEGRPRLSRPCEQIADTLFLIGLVTITCIALLLADDMI
ncbi:hypothetical protein [Methylobacterium tarhaniae]|uniref:hypothetical protein n=1 Tax=Methylobacterium tarhaniae TaxID=1187852 RepID=UPI003CFF8670